MPPSLHPWNRSFSWRETTRPLRRISEEQAKCFDASGYFVLEDAFEPGEVARIVREIEPWDEKVTAYLRTREGQRLFIADANAITFSVHLVTRSERLRAFCAGPVFRDLAHDLIGPEVRLYWDQAVYKKAGASKSFPWHQDNGYTYLEPQQYLTCWVALTDTDEENGCPWVVPGMHRLGTLAHVMSDAGWQCLEDPDGAVPVPARAGSIVVFSSLTPHATGPNRTAETRRSYIVQFAPDGARARRAEANGGEGDPGEPQNDPARQFPVLRSGREVA